MVLHGQVSEQSCTKLTLVAKISDTKFGSAQNYNKAPTLQCSWKSSFIRHIRHFLWLLGPNVWWQISQIWIEYIQLQCCPKSKILGSPTDQPRWIAGWSVLPLGGPYMMWSEMAMKKQCRNVSFISTSTKRCKIDILSSPITLTFHRLFGSNITKSPFIVAK